MTTTTATTAGRALTAEIRAMYQVGPRTRWNAKRTFRTLTREAIVNDIRHAIGDYRGIESERRTAILARAFTALLAYNKFIENYRIDGMLRFEIMDRSPWAFAAFLGEMVDSGCTNMAEFEMWFAAKAREANTRVAA